MSTLNVRIDNKIKEQASKTFSKLGLDLSSAIKLFLHQSIIEKGLPFTPSSDTKAIRARWDREVAHTLKNRKYHPDAKSALKELLE